MAAALDKPEREDERDKLIELKAKRVKATFLAAGIVITLLASLKTAECSLYNEPFDSAFGDVRDYRKSNSTIFLPHNI